MDGALAFPVEQGGAEGQVAVAGGGRDRHARSGAVAAGSARRARRMPARAHPGPERGSATGGRCRSRQASAQVQPSRKEAVELGREHQPLAPLALGEGPRIGRRGGGRRMVDDLAREGIPISRDRVRNLMRRIGLRAIY